MSFIGRKYEPACGDPLIGLGDDLIDGYAAMYEASGARQRHVTFEDFLRIALMLRREPDARDRGHEEEVIWE